MVCQINAAENNNKLPAPFWMTKPEVAKRMKDEGLLVVSSKTEKSENPAEKLKYHFNVVSGGVVKTNYALTDEVVRDFEKLKELDDHFEEVKYHKNSNTLYMHMSAMGFHARMHLKLKETKTSNSTNWEWVCVAGNFIGMQGTIGVREIERQKTEISIQTDYHSQEIPLPKTLLDFGLEVIGRQVGEKMRSYIHNIAKQKGQFFESRRQAPLPTGFFRQSA